MKKPIFAVLIFFLLNIPQLSAGAKYVMEIGQGKKILNTSELDLPPMTKASELLQMFPELLSRGGETSLPNYDVEVNGVNVGSSKDNILENYTLSEIKSIEVSSNPSTSQQKNGQGGLIKLKLYDLEEGVSGSAVIIGSSYASVMPGARLNYRKGKFFLRSTLMLEYDHPLNNTSRRETRTATESSYKSDTTKTDFGSEFFNLDLIYKTNNGGEVHGWLMQKYELNSSKIFSSLDRNAILSNNREESRTGKFGYLAGLKYTQNSKMWKFEGECTVSGGPTNYNSVKYSYNQTKPYWNCSTINNNTKVTGLLKYIQRFVPESPERKINLTGGLNVNNDPSHFEYDFSEIPSNVPDYIPQDAILKSHSSVLYLSPYIESENVFGAFAVKAGVRYQHYKASSVVENEEPSTNKGNYVTAFANLAYQLAPHHHLSMILDRSIRRMGLNQIYPVRLYDPEAKYFVKGNPELKPASLHNFSLNYITDFSCGKSNFVFDTEFKYINTSGIITSEKNEDEITYINGGKSDIFAANLLFLFSRENFSLSFTGNFFDNTTRNQSTVDRYQYFNLCLVPMLKFSDGWNASIKAIYNSHVYTSTSKLGDYIYVQTSFSKTWNKITAYLNICDNFHKAVRDEYYGKALSEVLLHNLTDPFITLGVKYCF